MSEVEVKDIEQLFLKALQAHQDNNIKEAHKFYQQVLTVDQDHIKTLCNLGVIYKNSENYSKALNVLNHALVIEPKNIIVLQNLVNLYKKINSFDKAIEMLKQAIEVEPKNALLFYDLATLHEHQGQIDQALRCYKESIGIDQQFIKAYHRVSFILFKQKRYDDAVVIYEMVLQFNENDIPTLCNLGVTLNFAKRYDEAVGVFEKTISLDPSINVYSHLGNSFNGLHRYKDALPCHLKAIEDHPKNAINYTNIAETYKNIMMIDQSIEALEKSIELKSDFAKTHVELATALLLNGSIHSGFKEYEWRYKTEDFLYFAGQHNVIFEKPRFTENSDVENKTLLIYMEVDNSNSILFIRYAALLKMRFLSLKLKIQCNPELRSLFENQEYIDEVVSYDEEIGDFDYQISVMSLPSFFETLKSSIPPHTPYLRSNQNSVDFDVGSEYMNIGIDWGEDESLSLMKFAPLLLHTSLKIYSLGLNRDPDEIKSYGLEDDDIVDLNEQLTDYQSLVSVITKLDLVITADTSVAQIAGALNKPVWVMLEKLPHWRWMLKSETSPWYPSMQLFRQEDYGVWDSVYENIFDSCERVFDITLKRTTKQDK